MEKSKERLRLIVLVLLIVAVFLTSSFRLMEFQVVNGASYREDANNITINHP